MYYEYWGLKKPPFDNVPDPSMYVESHASMENAIAETLFAIEEGGESIAVIVGDVGLGKTLSLRMIIDSLDQEKYKIALITNPSVTFSQLTREIIGQITGKPFDKTRKVDLLETFNRLLFETIDEGKKVLICIDEANAISPANLENLRLLTNMQDDQRNLFTMVLAGQNELARRLEHPKRANLFQRIGTYNKIEKIHSEDLVKTYVETRLKLAGGTRRIFADDVFAPLLKHSEEGVPRLINKICKLSLKAGETNGIELITGDMVDQIGLRFQRMSASAPRKEKPEAVFEEATALTSLQVPEDVVEDIPAVFEESNPEPVIEKPALYAEEFAPPAEEAASFEKTLPDETPELYAEPLLQAETPAPVAETAPIWDQDVEEKPHPRLVFEKVEPDAVPAESPAAADNKSIEIEIGDRKVAVSLPCDVMRQAHCGNREHRVKLAGVLAARVLQQHPQITDANCSDPVEVWSKIRESVLNTFEEEQRLGVM